MSFRFTVSLSVMEVINIVTSFQLTDGVPVMPLTQKMVA